MSDPFAVPNRARVRRAVWIGQDGRLECPACDKEFGTARGRTEPVTAGDTQASEEGAWTERRSALVGTTIELDRGYVNATTRHPSGIRHWYKYKPGKTGSPSPAVALPAVVTCSCGREVGLSLPEEVKRMARASRGARNARLTELLIAEAGDRWTQEQIDIARGK